MEHYFVALIVQLLLIEIIDIRSELVNTTFRTTWTATGIKMFS